MNIIQAHQNDFDSIWPIFHEVVSAGETYAYKHDTTKDEARSLWLEAAQKTFIAVEDGVVLGSYYLKPNQPGPASHVSNCGYMVSSKARGKGVAKAMCEHAQETAKYLGYKAMQYNFVVSTNTVAVKLWEKMGYDIVGRLPNAYHHKTKGYVDALVMYKWFEDS